MAERFTVGPREEDKRTRARAPAARGPAKIEARLSVIRVFGQEEESR